MSIRGYVLKVLLGSAVALLALTAGVAQATVTKLSPDGNFHANGSSGLAVDQSNGDVFAAGLIGTEEVEENGEQQIKQVVGRGEKFDPSGDVLSPPSPFTEGLHYGVAVNPVNGRLYVANPFGQVEIYDPGTGEQISSFAVPAFLTQITIEELEAKDTQIATDSSGDLYVPSPVEDKVFKYDEAGTLLQIFAGSGTHAFNEPTGVAVDSSGDVWIADAGNNRIEELSASGMFVTELESEGVRALALDGHGDVLAIVNNSVDNCGAVNPPCEHLVEYDEGGSQLADVGAGYLGSGDPKELTESMVAVDDATGSVYVSDGVKDAIWVYRPPSAPVLGQESSAEVGTFEAKLGVLAQPGGLKTTYRFEYDTREYLAGEGPHGSSVPAPEGNLGEGFSTRVGWASATGLAAGTTYHYRAIATNALGSVVGPDETFTSETVAQAACPNEQARNGFSADLPDCRAYELVTPPGKSSAQPITKTEREVTEDERTDETNGGLAPNNVPAGNGNRFAYESAEVMPGAQSAGLEFIATRGPGGWSSEDALPLQSYSANRCVFPVAGLTNVVASSPNLTSSIVMDHATTQGGKYPGLFSEACRGEDIEVVNGEPFEQNLLARDNEDGSYQLVNLTPPGIPGEPAEFVAASADLNVVVFRETAKLTPGAVEGAGNLYEWHEGALRLLKLELPSGAPVAGSVVAISADGSGLVFTADGKLYVRGAGGHTVQVDEARGGSGPGGGGQFAMLTSDGSQVFFTDEASAGLTSDTVAASGANLYRYDVNSGELNDLTPVGGANARLTDVSEDGSYLYFTSDGVQSGAQANQLGETAQSGQPNLYLDHDGATTFVLNAQAMVGVVGGFLSGPVSLISQSGAFLAFDSTSRLTEYDNTGHYEIYLYSAAEGRFKCASCNPSGEAPVGGGGIDKFPGAVLGSAPNSVSDNGQVFFETGEGLLPHDTDGQYDVYEFDFQNGLQLISTGTSASLVILLGASVSGNDVFFLTSQDLVPQDNSQEAHKIYDARTEGGFPVKGVPPACTTADACRAAASPQPSIYGATSSQTFSGAGNLQPLATAGVKPRSLTPTQKLTRALKACRREKSKRKRLTCERLAKKRYGAKVSRSKRSGKANTSKRGGK